MNQSLINIQRMKTNGQRRQIFDGPVPLQRGMLFEVRSKGTVIEFTNKRQEAYEAYFDAATPREVISINAFGHRTVVERTSDIRHLPSAEAKARGIVQLNP